MKIDTVCGFWCLIGNLVFYFTYCLHFLRVTSLLNSDIIMLLEFWHLSWFSQWQRSKPCEGTKFGHLEGSITCHDYQEIKIQESTHVLGVGAIPRSIPVILKDDLVDIVKAGGTTFWDLCFLFFFSFSF